MLLKVTKFNGRFDDIATQVKELSWDHFCHFLSNRKKCKEKWGNNNENPLFSPVEYCKSTEGYRVEGDYVKVDKKTKEKKVVGKVWINDDGQSIRTDLENNVLRSNVGVRWVYMSVFDYDSHPATDKKPEAIISIDSIKKILDEMNINYAIYSTHSSTKEFPRFRVIIPFKEPLNTADFERGWPFGFSQIDESCSDPARMYLMPSSPIETFDDAVFVCEKDRKFFSPKIEKEKKKKATAPVKKEFRLRGDYTTLDAYTWFTTHGCNPIENEPGKYWVICPWSSEHTGGTQGPTDTVLWTEKGKWPTFACSHDSCKKAKRDINAVMTLWDDQDSFCSEKMTPDKIKHSISIKSLGHDDTNKYYYQCNQTNHIVCLKANDHRELNFYSICAIPVYWFQRYGDAETGKVDWRKAAREMMQKSHEAGFFKPSVIRGGGIWEDEGRIVVHLGKKLLVNGKYTNIFDFKSDYVYEAMVKEIDLPAAATVEQSRRAFELICKLSFISSGQNLLLAGSIVCGHLSGILNWRPHLWITGNPGSGKTAILKNIVAPMWRPIGGVYAEGSVTEAGLRQVEIRHSAVPVIIDESESNDRRDMERVSGILKLARSASSDSDASIPKGSQTGVGFSYTVRSCFILCSIVENLEFAQDKERFTVLQVVRSEDSQKNWAQFRADLNGTFTKDFALAMYNRSIANAAIVKQNCVTIHKTLMHNVKDATTRWSDQISSLMAGAWLMLNDGLITEEQSLKFFQSVTGIQELHEKSEQNIPQKALSALMATIPMSQTRSLGDLISNSLEAFNGFEDSKEDNKTLIRYGLKVKNGDLYVSSNHPQIEKIMRDAGFTGHYNLLARLDGAKKVESCRFGMHVSCAVVLKVNKRGSDES